MASEDYYQNIYAPIRQTKATVSFELTAPEAKEKAKVAVNSNAEISTPSQLIDNVSNISERIATFEPNYWLLDGSFVLPVKPDKSEIEMGWWSKEISDENGRFKINPEINIEFSEVQSIARFGVFFDEASEEMASEFEIFVYDSQKRLILNEKFYDNENSYAYTKKGATNALSIKICFYKTKNPFRRIRVGEIGFGMLIKFDSEDILSVGVTSEADPLGRSFAVNELNLKIINNDRFDQFDMDSLAQYLYKRQAFEYSHCLIYEGRKEWIYGGAYFLDNWVVRDDTVEFTAKGKAGILENSTFYESSFDKMTVGKLIENVLKNAGFEYILPLSLKNSPLVTGFIGNVNNRQALGILAELSCCIVRENRQNTIEFVDILEGKEAIDVIDYENMFSLPKVKLCPYYNGVILKEKAISTKIEQIAKTQIEVAGTKEIKIYFDKPLYANTASYTLTGGFTLSNIKYAVMYMTASIKGNGVAEIVISGESAVFATSEKFYPAPWKDRLEPEYGYAVDLPMMFLNNDIFKYWFLERKFKLMKKRIMCSMNWRQNLAQEVGDTIKVQVNKKSGNLPMNVISETIEYKGGVLRGSTKTIGEAIFA